MLKRQTEVRKKNFWKKNDNFEGVWHPFGSDLGVWRFTYVICDLQTGNVQIFSRRYDHFLSKNFFIFESSDVSFAGVLSKILADGTSWWSPQPLLKIPAGGNIVVPPRPPALSLSRSLSLIVLQPWFIYLTWQYVFVPRYFNLCLMMCWHISGWYTTVLHIV